MPADLWLPVTPSIRRIAIAYLCAKPPRYKHIWWPLGWEEPISRHLMLPLHIPAGLAIARVRLVELNVTQRPYDYSAEEIARDLRWLDPELREAADAR